MPLFAENFALLPYNSNNGTPTYVLFNADCPLEIIKYDDLPFHRIYRTEDAVKVGSQVGWISGEYSEITTGKNTRALLFVQQSPYFLCGAAI